MVSNADVPVLLPFGAIVTGGKQDRMIREDTSFSPTKRSRSTCIVSRRGDGNRKLQREVRRCFSASESVLESVGNVKQSQGAIWSKVSEKNAALGNKSASANFQDNLRTPAFEKTVKELKTVQEEVSKQDKVCGAIVILDGKWSEPKSLGARRILRKFGHSFQQLCGRCGFPKRDR